MIAPCLRNCIPSVLSLFLLPLNGEPCKLAIVNLRLGWFGIKVLPKIIQFNVISTKLISDFTDLLESKLDSPTSLWMKDIPVILLILRFFYSNNIRSNIYLLEFEAGSQAYDIISSWLSSVTIFASSKYLRIRRIIKFCTRIWD